jgi:hypothetical protein
MRAIVALYFAIGIVLLILGYVVTGTCETPNKDAVNDTVFVLTWPVGVYRYVMQEGMTPTAWLHTQACGGGLGTHRESTMPAPTPIPTPMPTPAATPTH